MQQRKNQWMKISGLLFMGVLFAAIPMNAWADGPPKPSAMANPLAQVLVVIIGVLLLAIALLAHVVLGAAEMKMQRFRDQQKNNAGAKIMSVIALLFAANSVFAAEEPAAEAVVATSSAIGGLSPTAFYSLISVVGVELLVLLWLLYHLKSLLAKEPVAATASEIVIKESAWKKWWEKANSFRPVQEEANIDLGHNYDGIRELDNRLPPWWLYGFYICIIFSAIYLWRYHVTHTAPSSLEELAIVMEKAELDKENYLKKAANNVNENTVTFLTDATSLEAGKKVFVTACAACHAADGGGTVGPNLVDDYWIHGGSISDIFKSIKYGWPEKGMKSWKDDYSPAQIAQIASYIKSLKGTKPGTPKEPQGELYEEKPVQDTAKAAPVIKAGLN
ncbi:cbb3-type cytochrome c oxidase N-terminal domain-containing protein [Sediminibacterium sp. KACHI17]|jgi:cytochrome c oxidase cbb3-type subunit III